MRQCQDVPRSSHSPLVIKLEMSPPASSCSCRSSCNGKRQVGITVVWEWVVATYLKSIISPASELHLASLVVEREPSDIDFARRLKDARWDVHAGAILPNHNVRRIGTVKSLVGAAMKRLSSIFNRYFGCSVTTCTPFLVSHGHMGTCLLYMRTSGFQRRWGGILKSRTLPYSDVFQRRFMSFHS